MKVFESIASKFGPDLKYSLTAAEERALLSARRAVWDGSYGQTRAGLPDALIADLDSKQVPRQRAAINHPALQAYLGTEEQRMTALRSMQYFRYKFSSFDGLTFSAAASAVVSENINAKSDKFIEDSEKGRGFRRLTLLSNVKDDDDVLFVQAHFCKIFMAKLISLMHSQDPAEINDQQLRSELLKSVPAIASRLSYDSLHQVLQALERTSRCEEPRAYCCYLDVVREPSLKDALFAAHREGQFVIAAERVEEAARLERAAASEAKARERGAAAEVERLAKLLEAQLTFKADGGSLDVTPGDWIEIKSGEQFRRLFESAQDAFSRASFLRTRVVYEEEEFSGIRSIASMSVKQLACVKLDFWWNRCGAASRDTERMFWLLNSDGRIELSSGSRAANMFMMVHEGSNVDLEAHWSHHLDFLHKGIDAEGFVGDLARWIVEDKDNNNGWATSR